MASLFYKKFALAKIHFKKLTINQLFGLLLSLQGFKIIPFFTLPKAIVPRFWLMLKSSIIASMGSGTNS
ncbi:hypothetical protein BTH81_02240 [Lactobacillus delbrueckii subsp. bulgaricus]|nr:hypothetical protein [Lactobacillus delbrueckii subsp. bulgaricus]